MREARALDRSRVARQNISRIILAAPSRGILTSGSVALLRRTRKGWHFGRETPDYRPFYDEFGRWTAAGQFVP